MKTAVQCRSAMEALSLALIVLGILGAVFVLVGCFFFPRIPGLTDIEDLKLEWKDGWPRLVVVFAVGAAGLWSAKSGHGYAWVLLGAVALEIVMMEAISYLPGLVTLAIQCVWMYLNAFSEDPSSSPLLYLPHVMALIEVIWAGGMLYLALNAIGESWKAKLASRGEQDQKSI